ncbi:hypothetical protein ACFX13_036987 [Malus domestica]
MVRLYKNPNLTQLKVNCTLQIPNFEPFSFSDSKLRETVYEILIRACRISEPKPLTYIPKSEKTDMSALTSLMSLLQMSRSSSGRRLGGSDTVSQGRSKRTRTIWELVRVQMKVSEQIDTRVRRALLRVVAGEF